MLTSRKPIDATMRGSLTPEQIAAQQAHEELGCGDPHQHLADLERAKAAYDSERLWDDVRGRQQRQSQKSHQRQEARHRRLEHNPEIDDRTIGRSLMHDEGDEQHQPCRHEAPDECRVLPVQSIRPDRVRRRSVRDPYRRQHFEPVALGWAVLTGSVDMPTQQRQQVLAVRAGVDAVFVLDDGHVGPVQRLGGVGPAA